MKVEIGKTYLTAEGRKAKITHRNGNCNLISEYKDGKHTIRREWGNISFDGKEETLDTSFSIMPHDMKIIGGYRIENVEEKDNAQMFKVGDRVKQKSTDNYVYEVLDINGDGSYAIKLIENKLGWTGNIYSSVTDQNLKLIDTAPSSPVQSRKTLVPGVYGIVMVQEPTAETPKDSVAIRIDRSIRGATAEQLRDAIRVLGEVCEFLEEEGK